jgi:hypothetical protein
MNGPTLCSFCGNPIMDSCLTYKGLPYHALQGLHNGKLIHVDRSASCFEQSDMGTKSLVGQFAPTIMGGDHAPPSTAR